MTRADVSANHDLHAGGRVGAVIVTYHPSPQLRDNVAALIRQVDGLMIVDNGSGPDGANLIEEIKATFDCCVVLNEKNLGVAKALNLGIRALTDGGYRFIALFDQDSCVTEGFIESMLASYASVSGAGVERHTCMIVPTYVDRRSGAAMPLMMDHVGNVLTAMTSGSFFPVETFRRCGLFDEAFFVDYVDIEYCLRVSRYGFSILQSPATLFHSLGSLTHHRFGGKNFSATNHSAARRYYITRNRVTLFARYLVSRPGWVRRDLWAMMTETVKILLVEDDRFRKFGYVCLGLWDAALRRTGYRVAL